MLEPSCDPIKIGVLVQLTVALVVLVYKLIEIAQGMLPPG